MDLELRNIVEPVEVRSQGRGLLATGVAAGSGYQVSLLCDVRVIHSGVTMGQPEVSSGIPSITGMYLTERALGRSRTLEMMLTGRVYGAEEGYPFGFSHYVVDDGEGLGKALTLAHAIARRAGLPVSLVSGSGGQLSEALVRNEFVDCLAFVGG